MWYVTGGIYEDPARREGLRGEPEEYGPFASYEDALQKWNEAAKRQIDDFHHRLVIVER